MKREKLAWITEQMNNPDLDNNTHKACKYNGMNNLHTKWEFCI